MFKSVELFDKVAHRDLRLSTKVDYSYAEGVTSSPLVLREFFEASKYYPIVFSTQSPATPMALLGLTDRNLFLNAQNLWSVPYIPTHIRRYPFVLATGDAPENFKLAIDRAAPHFHSDGGEPLLTADGEASPLIETASTLLQAFELGMRDTHRALAPLEEAGVLVPRIIELTDKNTKRLIEGGRVVDEAKLYALDDATLATWVRSGLMQVIHAHWASMQHLKTLADYAERQTAGIQ